MGVRQCSSAHCGSVDSEINEVCTSMGWAVNHPVVTRDAQGPCLCSCSCLAFGTPVQIGDNSYRPIEEFVVGDNVLACGKDLKWQKQEVMFSNGTTGASRQKYTVLIAYNDTQLVVTSDHLLLMDDGNLKAADRLAIGDKLMDPKGNPVNIDSVHIGDYTAGFHHIATTTQEPDADLDGHLLNTNGVVTADYAVQMYYRSGESKKFMKNDQRDLPVVGSPEYVEKHGPACLKAPAAVKGGPKIATYNSPDLASEERTFVSAEATMVKIPKDACSFISKEEAAKKALEPMRQWNDPMPREWTEYLLKHHKLYYPDVTFILDWANNEVNAYAWVDNGVRFVSILGGLVRHTALEMEGIALVTAHELGHHYGGPPTWPGGLSCEGQADYYGVNIIMRNAWFGEFYYEIAIPAIAQMAAFFGVGSDATGGSASAGCSHPPGACRIDTYNDAVDLKPKPVCAG